MHVLSVALFDKPAFKNCIVHGTILAGDGKKLSKSSKNYSDPMDLMMKYGTDAFRLYMYQSNAMLIGDLLFNEEGIPDMYQQILLPFWNACNFYISYANIDGFHPRELLEPNSDNQLDRWILAELHDKSKAIELNMDAYLIDSYVEPVVSLINGLTNWYIRRSRRRFWGSDMTEDKRNAYETLYYVLVNMTKLLAPLAPIISEMLYKTLTGEFSVHLADWPKIPESYQNRALVRQVDTVQSIITLARSIRNKNGIKNRQPLSLMKVAFTNEKTNELISGFGDTIAEELNVKKIEILKDVSDIATIKYDPNFNEIRNRYPERVAEIIKAVKTGQFEISGDKTILTINGSKESFDSEIILITYQSREEMPVASNLDMVVSLDLTITEELRNEGLAREIVRHIQEARKQLGCDIMDKIAITITGGYPEQWADYIQSETLSRIVDSVTALTTIELQSDNGSTISIQIGKGLS
jgi:isoleucyl-tRNA synthetase